MKRGRLGDYVDFLYGKSLPAHSRRSGSVPVFGSAGRVGSHDEALVKGPGVIVGRKGTVGTVHWSDDDFYPIDTTYYVVPKNEHELRHRYVYYLLNTLSLRNMNTDSAVPGLNRSNALSLHVAIAPSVQQDSIVDILSAYDDLIENNRRRMRLLERAARLLYQEWFVRFRFPGHETCRHVNGIPDAWKRATAFDVMDILSGGTPDTSTPHYWSGEIPFFTPKDATGGVYVFSTEKHLSEEGLQSCNSRLYPKDTVFISARGTVGKIAMAQTDMAMSQSSYALLATEPLSQPFLYLSLLDGVEQLRSRAVGSVFAAIVRNTFRSMPFIVPERRVIRMFTDIVSPMFRQIDVLSHEVRKLTQARDLLLPRLMSGRIAA